MTSVLLRLLNKYLLTSISVDLRNIYGPISTITRSTEFIKYAGTSYIDFYSLFNYFYDDSKRLF